MTTLSLSRFLRIAFSLSFGLLSGFILTPVHAAPTVSLTAPLNGATYTAPAAISLNATAADSNGISKVEFYQGEMLLGTDTTSPYTWALSNVAAGGYNYRAMAYNSLGISTLSPASTVTVTAANPPPTVSLTAPLNGATFTAPAAITLSANAADANGITKVEFYQGAVLLGTDTVAPYTWALSNVAIGTYSYTAKAYDSLSASTVSAAATVTVSATNTPPTVSLTTPLNGATFTAPAAITLSANAADGNGISKVEFYRGEILLGTDTATPYTLALSNVAVGTYSYTAKAYDNLAASTVSAASTITVNAANTPPTVSLTAPLNGATYTAPAAITLNATAADSHGITKVEFYQGATLLGTDTLAPYTWALSNVAIGTYSYTAKAYDSLAASTVSTATSVTVKAANLPPAITALTATPQTLLDTATSQLQVVASDPDAKPSPLSFSWSIVSGGGSLSSSTLTNPVYTPANVSAPTSAVIKVSVSDGAATASQNLTLTVNDTPVVATVTITYYHNDALGSPIAATGPTGNLLWRESYRPYGERLDNQAAGATNPIWYTGKRQDPETGLVYMGARYYNPALGRFLSMDPVGLDENNLHSLNRYAYANNNPYRFTDPDGNIPIDTVWDAGNVVYDLGKAAYGAATNNPALVAQGLGDAAADTAAMLIPYVPAGSTKVARGVAEKAGDTAKSVTVSKSRFPESAKHIEDALAAGKPSTLTIDRANSASRRRDALRGTGTRPGLDRDEFPPAMFREGGQNASVRHVRSGDNRGAGACVGGQCRGLPNGTKVKIDVVK